MGYRSSNSRQSALERKEAIRKRLLKLKARVLYIVLSPWRFFKVLCFSLGLVVFLTGTGAAVYAYTFFQSLPKLEKMSFEGLKTRARNRTLARLEDKKKLYRWTPVREMSRDLLYTVVMSEDGTFFEHNGVNYDAMVNSFAVNLRRRSYDYGASTISQQVVKNLFLTQEKSLVRKAKEILITQDLEKRFTKNEILELYLNMAEFGPDLFGVRAAAKAFFDKSPDEVNAAEGAFMAVMLPSPRRNYYSIYENQHLSEDKRKKIRRILRDMLHFEFISPKQYNAYSKYDFFKRGVAGKK